MGKTKTKFEKLKLLGVSQLALYLLFLFGLVILETIHINVGSRDAEFSGGIYPTMWIPFAGLGLLLVPSSIPFIRAVKSPNLRAIKVARVLQIVLFALVAVLTVPAYSLLKIAYTQVTSEDTVLFRFSTPETFLLSIYFLACVIGIAYFPLMLLATKKALKVDPSNQNSDLIKQ